MIYLIFSQFLKTLNSPLINNISTHTGLNEVKHYVSKVFFPVSVLNKKFLGITEGLIYTNFNEGDFYMTTLVYEAPDGKKTWLPLLDEQGMVSPTATGRLFTKWNRVNFSYPAEMDKFERGLVQFSAFWGAQHNISLQQAEFRILQKKMLIEFEWKKDFLEDHLKAPWQEIGTLRWKNNKPELHLHK